MLIYCFNNISVNWLSCKSVVILFLFVYIFLSFLIFYVLVHHHKLIRSMNQSYCKVVRQKHLFLNHGSHVHSSFVICVSPCVNLKCIYLTRQKTNPYIPTRAFHFLRSTYNNYWPSDPCHHALIINTNWKLFV